MPKPRDSKGAAQRRRRHLDAKADRGARNLREIKMQAARVKLEVEAAAQAAAQQENDHVD